MAIHPLPGSGGQKPRQISAGLERVVKSLGLPAPNAVQTVFQAWDSVVGPELAQHCRPIGLKQGHLTVKATDQAWATELKWMESALVQRCADELGEGVVTSVGITV